MSLKRIAEELGLSLTTVSRALNGYPEVAESTRAAVAAAAARLQHQPDRRARALASGRSGAVGIVFPLAPADLGDPQFLAVAHAASECLARVGQDLLIIAATADDELGAYRRAVAGRRVDAFIVPRTRVRDERLQFLQAAGFAFVAHGRSEGLDLPYAWFDLDNEAGAHLATRRLIDLGHRRIGYLGADPAYNFATQRYRGHAAALAGAGRTIDPARVQRGAIDRRGGHAAMRRLLALDPPPTAVLVDNHLAGTGAVHAALEAGCVLGRTLSVIVFDGVDPDSVFGDSVTSVGLPSAEAAGTTLAELVLGRLAHASPEALQRLRVPVLVAGTSDGPVPVDG